MQELRSGRQAGWPYSAQQIMRRHILDGTLIRRFFDLPVRN
jgi:hypothetical protein